MEDQGIMALPQAGMQAPTTEQGSPQSQAAIAAFDQARNQIDPTEFGQELLTTAEQVDPAAVQEFRASLEQLNLPPEIIDALGKMVDLILSEDPANYPEIRASLIEAGVPEDILPEQFDALYFSALNMALDQLNAKIPTQPMPQAFAKGGIAQLTPVAAGVASMGRGMDTRLAHITPSEARMLRRYGGSGTLNPNTGLPEYGWNPLKEVKNAVSSIGSAIGGAVKSVGKVVVNAVQGVAGAVKKFVASPVGKVVTAVALGFFVGPSAASMLGVSSAAGVAAVSGFIGSAGSSLLGGGNLKTSLKQGLIGGLTAGAMAGAFDMGQFTPENVGLSAPVSAPAAPAAPAATAPIAAPTMEPGAFDMGQFTPADVGLTRQAPTGFTDTLKQGYEEYIKPYTPSGIQESGRTAAEQVYRDTLSRTGSEALAMKAYEGALPGLFSSYAPMVAAGTIGASALGMFDPKQEPPPGYIPRETGFDLYNQNPSEYGVTPGGATVSYAPPNINPGEGYSTYLGSSSGYGTMGNPFMAPRFNVRDPRQYLQQPYGIAALAPRRFNTGGFAAGGGIRTLAQKYPRRTGQISGPGTETSDSIPAMLSDGEFVLTAKAVRGAGNGSRREGAKRMYAMMRKLERKANG